MEGGGGLAGRGSTSRVGTLYCGLCQERVALYLAVARGVPPRPILFLVGGGRNCTNLSRFAFHAKGCLSRKALGHSRVRPWLA